jgi:hypothetical protein
MIDWGRTPVGSVATLYLPEVSGEAVLDLAKQMYRSSHLVLIDEHTVQTRTGAISWIPIPKGNGNLTGLLTIDLPPIVRAGQSFAVVARQVTTVSRPVIGVAEAATVRYSRRILGSFQVTIPVQTKDVLLAPQRRLLSNLRFIERSIPSTDRWYAAFRRYVSQIAARVDGLGGDSTQVAPSPSGDWHRPTAGLVCRILEFGTAALLAMLIAILGITTGTTQLVLGVFALAILLGIAYAWIRHCRPTGMRIVRTLALGIVVGFIVLMLLIVLGP